MSFLIILLFLAIILKSSGTMKLEEELMERKHCLIRSEYFKLMHMYYKTIYTVTVVDLLPQNSVYECTSQYFLKRAFPHCEVNIIYNRDPQETINVDNIDPMLNTSLDKDYPAKIRINNNYGFGLLVIVENIVTLINYLKSGGLDGSAFNLASANHVAFVPSTCSVKKHRAAENFLVNAWQKHFISHLLVLLNDCGDFAFHDVISKGHNTNINGIIKWIDVKEQEIENITSLFTYMTKNFRRYPLRFTLFDRYATMVSEQNLTKLHLPGYMRSILTYSNGHSGIDGIVLSYLVEKLNLNPLFQKYDDANYGAFNKKTEQFDGTLGDIVYNRSDVAVNGRYIKDYGEGTEDVVEFLDSVFFDRICVITPKAQEIPKWKAPLLIFSIYSWIGLFSIQLGSSLVWYLLKKWEARNLRCQRLKAYKSINLSGLSELTIETALILFSAPSPVMPYLRQVERILMASFLFVSFYTSGIFQASLTSSMSTTSFESDINTLEQLDKSHLQIWTGSHSLADLFGDSDTSLIASLKKKIKIRDSEKSNIWNTAHSRNICSIERENDAEFVISTKYMRKDGYPLVNVMNECPRAYYIGYMVRKGWPFSGDFSRIITRFKEAGLTYKWYYDIQNAIVNKINLQNRFGKNGPEAFTLRHLIFSFYLLAIGLTLSFLVLLVEVFVKKGK